MKIRIFLFGMLEDIAGKSVLEINNAEDTDSIKIKTVELYPEFSKANFVISVNRKIINANQRISEKDEIAFLPPFAGG